MKDKVIRYIPLWKTSALNIQGGGGEGTGRPRVHNARPRPRAPANCMIVQARLQPALRGPEGSLRIKKRKGKFSEKEMLGTRRNMKRARMFWGLRQTAKGLIQHRS